MSTCEHPRSTRGASSQRSAEEGRPVGQGSPTRSGPGQVLPVPPSQGPRPLGPCPVVELVDAGGVPLGELPVDRAHTPPGRLHRAFSVLVTDADGRVLLQRRSRAKSRFAGLWSNACCGHPGPGQDLAGAAAGRLLAEMGLRIDHLVELGRFVYRARDPASPFEEHEYDHVFLGSTGRDPRPDPDEADAWRWAGPGALAVDLAVRPERHTPWLGRVLSFLPDA